MGQNLYEELAKERYQDIQREIAQRSMLKSLPRRQRNVGRHVVSKLGAMLVTLGTRLEQVEQHSEQGAQPANLRV